MNTTVNTQIERTLRSMTKADRRSYLLAHGWRCLSNRGAGWWQRPDDPSGFWSLAAAIRTALREEQAS
jgi:hypothetical protein